MDSTTTATTTAANIEPPPDESATSDECHSVSNPTAANTVVSDIVAKQPDVVATPKQRSSQEELRALRADIQSQAKRMRASLAHRPSSANAHPKVLVARTGFATVERVDELDSRVIMLKGDAVWQWRGDDYTHVVVETNEFLRHAVDAYVAVTCPEYFCAIARRRWIVDSAWVDDSAKAGRFLDETVYEVVGETESNLSQLACGPRLARVDVGSPLGGYRFCITEDCLPQSRVSMEKFDVLRFVVKHTAQQLFTSLDRMAEYVRDNPNASRPFIVAGCLDAYHVSKESKELCDRLGIRVVCQCLIWDSLSTWSKLTYWPYLLYGKLNRVRHIDRRLHAFDPAALERLDEIANAAENCDDSIDDDDDDDDDLIDGAGDVAPRSPLSDFTLSPDSSVKSVNASPDAESSVSAKQTTTTRQQSPAHYGIVGLKKRKIPSA